MLLFNTYNCCLLVCLFVTCFFLLFFVLKVALVTLLLTKNFNYKVVVNQSKLGKSSHFI